ncbi:MAG: hypothetical protein HUU31_01955, partial [Anaerolineae bacterium]|nr:hypothetical protein [Anaerolineae bacterium]
VTMRSAHAVHVLPVNPAATMRSAHAVRVLPANRAVTMRSAHAVHVLPVNPAATMRSAHAVHVLPANPAMTVRARRAVRVLPAEIRSAMRILAHSAGERLMRQKDERADPPHHRLHAATAPPSRLVARDLVLALDQRAAAERKSSRKDRP